MHLGRLHPAGGAPNSATVAGVGSSGANEERSSIFDLSVERQSFSVFDRPARPEDAIPDGWLERLERLPLDVDVSTVRLVKRSPELSLYAARRGEAEICLFAIHAPTPDGTIGKFVSCGSAFKPLMFGRQSWVDGEFAVGRVPDGWTAVEYGGVEGSVENNAFLWRHRRCRQRIRT